MAPWQGLRLLGGVIGVLVLLGLGVLMQRERHSNLALQPVTSVNTALLRTLN